MKNRQHRQAGIVSIMVTMILLIVITLIVLGFAEVSRREQTNAVDAQLSSQAYYAAESGINDARSLIINMLRNGIQVTNKQNCGYDANYPQLTSNSTIDSNHNVDYTCVLIDTNSPTLSSQISHVPWAVPLTSGANKNFQQLTFNWQQGSGLSSNPAGCSYAAAKFPPATSAQWPCTYPEVRVDLFDQTGPTMTRANWANATETLFLNPVNGGGTSSSNFAPGGFATNATCTSGSGCTYTIRLTGPWSSKQLYMRVSTLYRDNAKFTISTLPNNSFSGAQATIDSTGQAQDVLRRIRVAIDLTNNSAAPEAAITSEDSICKRFEVTNGYFDVPSDSAGMNSSTDPSAAAVPLCMSNPPYGSPNP